MKKYLLLFVALLGLSAGVSFLVQGCDASRTPTAKVEPSPETSGNPLLSDASNLPVVQMPIGSRSYQLEVAADDPSRQRGLMYRKSMPADRGMIFVFPDEDIRGFWMRNTFIPLDIVYLDRKGEIVSIHPMTPLVEYPSVSSDYPAMYAIELNQGQAAAAGLRVGQRLALPSNLPHPEQ